VPSSRTPTLSTELGEFRLTVDGIGSADTSPEEYVRRHAAILAFGRRTSAQPPIHVLMQDAMNVIVEVLDADFGGTGEVVEGGTLVMKVAAVEWKGMLARPVEHRLPLAPETSLAGYALNQACPVDCPDLATEKRFADAFLRRLEVASALCVPLNLGNAVFGALGVYRKKPKQFSTDDLHFVETIAHLLTASVSRATTESHLSRERVLTESLLDLVETLVLTLDARGNLQTINRACERATGFSPAHLQGRPLWQVLIPPDEVEVVQEILQTCLSGVRPCEFEASLLTREGHRRRAVWAVRMIPAPDGGQSLLMAGADRTEYLQLQEELQKAKLLAEKAVQALAELRTRYDALEAVVSCPSEDARALPPSLDRRIPTDSHETQAPQTGPEQRSSPRREFHYYQLIAPVFGQRMPLRKEFFPVECRDISAGGISFVTEQRPDFEELVVILGRAPAESYFSARVVRVSQETRGKKLFVVGCKFIGRVTL